VTATVIRGDARRLPLPDASVDLIVTSPPYFGLRSYTDACDQCGGEGRATRPDSHGVKVCPNGCESTGRKRCHYCGESMRWPPRKAAEPSSCAACGGTGQRHYDGQIGSEATPQEWVAALVDCTREWARVLKPSGSMFINLGDKYSTGNSGQSGLAELGKRWAGGGHSDGKAKRPSAAVPGMPPKCLLGLPWRYALACTDQLGLILRAEIIWAKPNGLPESVGDRVRRAHEQVFHLVKQPRYYTAIDEIREPHAYPDEAQLHPRREAASKFPGSMSGHINGTTHPLGKLPGSVWTIPSAPLAVPPHLGVDHFAAFPPALVRPIILGWSPPGICTTCGQGRQPVVDKQLAGVWHDKPAQTSRHLGTRTQHGHHFYGIKETFGSTAATITGYVCACPTPDAPTRPAVVLDPFGGTGTTALVASVHGRHAITIDLSADYCRLAQWRTSDPGERARAAQVEKPPPVIDGQETLFTVG